MKDFFVSYTKADRQWAEWIAWTLEKAGYSVVLQAWDILPGMNFPLEMHRAINDSERTLLVLSNNYLRAEFTYPEWAAAFVGDPKGAMRKLIPVRIEGCNPPGLLATIVYIDLHGLDKEAAERELINVLISRRKPEVAPAFPGGSIAPASGGVAARGDLRMDDVRFKPSSLGTLEEAVGIWSQRHFSQLFWGTEGRSGANWEGERQRRYMLFAAKHERCSDAVQTLSRYFPVYSSDYSPYFEDRAVYAYEVRISAKAIVHNGQRLPVQLEAAAPFERKSFVAPDNAELPLWYKLAPNSTRYAIRPGDSLELPLTLSFGIDFEAIYQSYSNDPRYAGDLYELGRRHLKAGRDLHQFLEQAAKPEGALAISVYFALDDGGTREIPLKARITQGLENLPAWDGDVAAVLQAIDRIEGAAKPEFDEHTRRLAQESADEYGRWQEASASESPKPEEPGAQ